MTNSAICRLQIKGNLLEKIYLKFFKHIFSVYNVFIYSRAEGIEGPFPVNNTDGKFMTCFTKNARFYSDLEVEIKEFRKY